MKPIKAVHGAWRVRIIRFVDIGGDLYAVAVEDDGTLLVDYVSTFRVLDLSA